MVDLVPAIRLAGVVQVLIASANVFAPKKFAYRENLRRVTPIVREVFIVQGVFVVLTVLGFAALCLLFPAELASRNAIGRFLSAFLALFWGLRLLIQLCFYDVQLRRQHRLLNTLFVTAFAYLTSVFALAATSLTE